MANNVVNNAMKPVDSYLQFVQEVFNVDSPGFNDIVKSFNIITKNLQDTVDRRAKESLERAQSLRAKMQNLNIIKDDVLFDRFEDLMSTYNITSPGATDIMRVAKDLVYDLQNARDWLSEYQKLLQIGFSNQMEQLITLGKAILARAVELCPIDTGLLRSSGTLIVYGDSIVIVFAAPYATYVHENMENYHPYGRAKFLEIALQEFLPNKQVWVEILGESTVYAKISIGNRVTYKHHGPY